jgi:iron complex outermembrane receptor protein
VFRNIATGSDVQDDKLLAGRVQFLLAPTDSVQLDLSADHSVENRKPQGGKCYVENRRITSEDPNAPDAFADGVLMAAPSLRAFAALVGVPLDQQQAFLASGQNSFFNACNRVDNLEGLKGASELSFARDDLKTVGTSGTLTWEISDSATFKSISAWRRNLLDTRADLDFTELNLVQPALGAGTQTYDAITQEVQLTGSAFADRLNYVIGLFGLVEKNDGHTLGGIATRTPLFFSANLDLDGQPFFQAFADRAEVRAAYPNAQPFMLMTPGGAVPAVAVPGAQTLGILDVDNLSYAAYTQGTYEIDERLSLTLGLRWTHERKRVANQIIAITPGVVGGNLRTAGETDFAFERSARFSNLAPMANLSYQATEDLLLYTSFSKGFKSGGFNGRANADSLTHKIDDEKLTAYEAGLKSTWFDRRIVFNASAFWNIYDNIQLTRPRGGNAQAQIAIENPADAVIKGAEIEARLLPLPGLELSSAIGITRARYIEFDDPTDRQAKDRRLLGVANYTMNFAAAYQFALGGFGDLRLRAEWLHRGASGTDVVESRVLRRGKNGELDGQITWSMADGFTELSLFGKNLLDREFFTNGVSLGESFGHGYRFYNDPRTYGLEIRRQF